MMFESLPEDRAGPTQLPGTAIQLLSLIHFVSAGIAEAEQRICLGLKRLMPLCGLKAMLLVVEGRLFLVSPALEALLQLIAEPVQGPSLQPLLMEGAQAHRQGVVGTRRGL